MPSEVEKRPRTLVVSRCSGWVSLVSAPTQDATTVCGRFGCDALSVVECGQLQGQPRQRSRPADLFVVGDEGNHADATE